MAEHTVELYGYQEQRQQITDVIADLGTLCFVCLNGPGGIGKTTMLRFVFEEYRAEPGYRVTELLDFDDLRLHLLYNVLDDVARQLGKPGAQFRAYFEARDRLRQMQEEPVISWLHIQDQEKRVRGAFVHDYNQGDQRAVLFFDTVERIQDSALWSELVNVLLQLHNTAVVLAGRRNKELGEALKHAAASHRVEVIQLDGLSADESLKYFCRTELGKFLYKENRQRTQQVCRLSAGKPILLDLAVDWLGQGMKLNVPGKALDKLDEPAFQEVQREFERGLVRQVANLAEPRNEAILEMAHIYHYFDAERYRYLHPKVSPEAAQALVHELCTFSFVKPQPGGGIRLHDEMRRMVREWVWPLQDGMRKRRRWLSDCMAEFLERQLADRKEGDPIWQAKKAEQLYHQLYADIRQGHRAFGQVFRQALGKDVGFARMLVETLSEVSDDFADDELRAWLRIHEGRLLRAEEKVPEAIDLIRPAKERLQALGVHEELDTVCNALGYSYRLLGRWEQAISAFEEALIYSREERDDRQIAETMNNIANTCRLNGDLEKANRYSLIGLKIRERLGDRRAIGYSCFVRGMVCWESGNTAEAAEYARRARTLFTGEADQQGIAEIDRFDSYLRFRTGDLEAALACLSPAQAYHREQANGLGLADTLNLQARILIDKYAAEGETAEDFQRIQALADEALSFADRIHDSFTQAECRLTLCRLYARWARYCDLQGDKNGGLEYRKLARDQYSAPDGGEAARRLNYLALSSVYEWTIADLAFDARDWKAAFDHYLQELATSARFKEARFARALNGLSDRIHRLAPDPSAYADAGQHLKATRELQRQYCDTVIAGWEERGLHRQYPEVVEECEYIKNFLGLEDPKQIARLERQGEDLLVLGEWQRAIDVNKQLLDARRTYELDEQAARAMNQSAWAYRQMGRFTQARRLCQQALLISQSLRDKVAIADNRLVMGTIMWVTGNTSEAARYLRIARQLYEESGDEKGLARARRHTGFLHFRINDFEKAEEYLRTAEQTLRERALDVDLADVLNLHARLLRANQDPPGARKLAEEAVRLSQKRAAHYTLAEAWLTLMLIEQDEGRKAQKQGKEKQAQQHYARASELYTRGYPIAERCGNALLVSAYESAAGEIAFAQEKYADAFEHFARDLETGVRYEHGRLRRELDRILDRLVCLPDDMRRFYAEYILRRWQDGGLNETEPDVPRLFELLMEYEEYV